MDPKRVKYSPATFLNLEREYLSSIVRGKYAETIPITYRGQRFDAWGQLHQAFPAPSPVQMRVDELRVLRNNAKRAIHPTYVCGCEYCARFEADVPYFHSVMDDMLLQLSPKPTHLHTNMIPSSPVFAFTAMGNVLSIVHVYEDYAMLHDVTAEMPETPMFSLVKVRPSYFGEDEDVEKRLAKSLSLRRMKPTKLVFAKRLDF